MVVLITGATGLLGRHVIAELKAAGREHIALVRRPGQLSAEGVRTVVGDLSKSGFTNQLPTHVKHIIHLAQSANYRMFPDAAGEVFDVNLRATQELLQFGETVGIERFVYASSGGVYKAGALSLKEDTPLREPDTLDFYLSTKLASELFVHSYRSIFDNTILRFFFIYGPGQKRSMLLPRLFDTVAEGREIQLGGQVGITVNPIHAIDAAKAVGAAIDLLGSNTINVGGPEEHSLRGIGELLGRYLGTTPRFVGNKGAGEDRLVADIKKMSTLLTTPSIGLHDGVADLAR